MKLFRATTTVKASKPISTDREFVDWYEAETLERAKELWGEDVHRYQLPADQTTVVFVECNPETLKPL